MNDTHGNAAGDLVLQAFATEARATLRNGDLLARWGGEEFLLLLPTGDPDSAHILAKRLREHAAQSLSRYRRAARFHPRSPTVSIGVTSLREGKPTTKALERADAALYRAKAGGRNRVESV